MEEKCDVCGGDVIAYRELGCCPICGAPNCCPTCCREAELELIALHRAECRAGEAAINKLRRYLHRRRER